MPYDYFIRVTHSYDRCASMVSRWALECSKILVYEHVGSETEKVHIHCVLRDSRLQKKQLRNIGSNFVDLKGNENCSFKECVSEETPVTYMSKGNLQPKYNKGYDPEWVETRRCEWQPPQQYVKVSALMSLYLTFENQCYDEVFNYRSTVETADDPNRLIFNFIKRTAYKWLFAKYQICSPKFFSDYKTLVMTMATKGKISIPRDCRWSEWL